MKRACPRAFLPFLVLLFAACSNMGAGSDPANTEGVFSLFLPPEISLGNQASEEIAADAQAEDEGEEIEPSAEAAPKGRAEDAALAGAELAPANEEDEAANAEEGALAVEAEGLGDAKSSVTASPTVAVSRWLVSMVSAMGFERHESIAPSEEPVLLTVQAGQWKILVLAENAEGAVVARCGLNGVSLSPEEEKPVPLAWQPPDSPSGID